MKTLTIAALTLAMITAASAQNQTTYRDASGRITGTVSTDSNGTKTFRDGSGRTTGTATVTATARQRSVTLAAGPLAQPQRRDAEFGGSRSRVVSDHSRPIRPAPPRRRRSRSRRPPCASSLASNTRRTAKQGSVG